VCTCFGSAVGLLKRLACLCQRAAAALFGDRCRSRGLIADVCRIMMRGPGLRHAAVSSTSMSPNHTRRRTAELRAAVTIRPRGLADLGYLSPPSTRLAACRGRSASTRRSVQSASQSSSQQQVARLPSAACQGHRHGHEGAHRAPVKSLLTLRPTALDVQRHAMLTKREPSAESAGQSSHCPNSTSLARFPVLGAPSPGC
jgi:hypothetical protein